MASGEPSSDNNHFHASEARNSNNAPHLEQSEISRMSPMGKTNYDPNSLQGNLDGSKRYKSHALLSLRA
jgi:hypothetical protein